MKKNSIIYALAALVGISGILYCADQLPDKPDSVVLSEGAARIAPIESTDAAPVITQVPVILPILVPFNQDLYTLCCKKKQSYWWNGIWKLANMTNNMAIMMNIVSVIKLSVTKNSFKALTWYWKLWTGGWIAYQSISIVFLMLSTLHASKTFSIDFNEADKWTDREIEPLLIRQEIWHKEIRACFGNPIVEGSVPAVGKYYILGEKKSGAGKVIFDPFDLNQVKILLGIHERITENLQCKKITIVPLT